jgi:hypothetical protein
LIRAPTKNHRVSQPGSVNARKTFVGGAPMK